MPLRSLSLTLAWCFAQVVVLTGLSCQPSPQIFIDTPLHGAFIDASSVLVEGHTNRYSSSYVVRVNGIETPLQTDKTWSVTIPLDQQAVTNPIDAEMEVREGFFRKDRITVVAGPSIPDGSVSPEGVALRFNNSGLESIEPTVENLAGDAFDIGDLILSQNPIVDGEEFSGFTITANAYEADFNGFSLSVTAQAAGHTDALITVNDLHLGVKMNIQGFDDCTLELDAATAVITGSYDMLPDAGDPSKVDVNQLGDADVTLSGISYQFISGACDPDAPLIGDLVNAILAAGSTIEDLMEQGFRDNLQDPDGSGPLDAPIAAGIQEALAGISIAGEVGAAVGLQLDAPFFQIAEDADGIFLGADAAFTSQVGTGPGQCSPPASAPDLLESLDVAVTSPGFGALTPGGSPYALGLAISASAFNQLLKASVECGLLSLAITEIDVGGTVFPVDSSLMGLFGIPEFASVLGPGVPLEIRITPTMGPLVTPNPGPSGEMAELAIPYLLMDIVEPTGTGDVLWLSVAVDTRVGLELVFDPVAAELAPTLTPPLVTDTLGRVVQNAIGASEPSVEASIPFMVPALFQFFGDIFGSFPLPTFLGLQLDVLEIERAGGFFNLYTNLAVVPVTRIENVAFTDLSQGDFVEDGVFDVWEWRHRTKLTTTPSAVDAQLQGVVAVDACCTLDDEEMTQTPRYRVEFDVVPENGESWQLDIDHGFLGALTLVDEANAIYDGAERAEITTPIQGRYSLDGGAFVSFNFGLAPVSSVSDGFGGAENDQSVEVSGTNGVALCGSAPSSVTLEFDWTAHVKSDSNVVFPAIDGGEAAVRFGVHDTITLGTDPSPGFTAGNYPGLGGREISQDGHFTTVRLTALPGGCP